MSIRYPAGFIRIGYDPLKVPNAPTIGTATAGDTQASVAFTAPSNVGGSAISSYTAVSTPSGISASGASSPITVTGLTNGTAYTFAVWALNTYGPSAYSAASGSVTPVAARGVFGGGEISGGGTYYNNIDYVLIATTGNATDFGDLSATTSALGSCASSTRGIFAGGITGVGSRTSAISYITISTAGNASSFGNLTVLGAIGSAVRYGLQGCNSSTRGVFGGGNDGGGNNNAIQYITIASTGNSVGFGDLTRAVTYVASLSSPTRGVWAGGGASNIIDYVTIASLGNATDFGDLAFSCNVPSGCASSIRGLISLGFVSSAASNVINYITIASLGNATDFGDLTVGRYASSSASSSVRGLFAGGDQSGTTSNIIDYVTINTTGNATDFGDLTLARRDSAGLSSDNGGLQ